MTSAKSETRSAERQKHGLSPLAGGSPPGRAPGSEFPPAHKIVAAYLERCCKGRAAARTKDRIVGELKAIGLILDAGTENGDPGTGHPESATRRLERIMHTLATASFEVGSNGKGYFWCVEDADFDEAEANVDRFYRPLGERLKGIKRARARVCPPKEVLFDVYGRT
jgi:hypothetical protein